MLEQQCELTAALNISAAARKAAQTEATTALATAATAEESRARAEAATAAAQAEAAAALTVADAVRVEAEAKAERLLREKARAVAETQANAAALMMAETDRLDLLKTAARERTLREEVSEAWNALRRAEQKFADRSRRAVALTELTELRCSRAWRLARFARYARTQILRGSFKGRLRGGRRVLRRLIQPDAALPAHDPVFDVMRLLEEPTDAVPSGGRATDCAGCPQCWCRMFYTGTRQHCSTRLQSC